jgi:hypothetical protein
MFKWTIIIIFCSSITIAWAQTQTGGRVGPNAADIPMELGEKSHEDLTKQYRKILKEINQRWTKCSPGHRLKIESLKDLHLHLIWLKLGETSPVCEEDKDLSKDGRHERLNCVLNKEIKRDLQKFLNHPKVMIYLKFEEDLDRPDQLAKDLLEFTQ